MSQGYSIRAGYLNASTAARFIGFLGEHDNKNEDDQKCATNSSRGTGIPVNTMKDDNNRTLIKPGYMVDVIRKEDQRTGKRTRGTVLEILTGSMFHPHGIKVRLKDGSVGRVAEIIEDNPSTGEKQGF